MKRFLQGLLHALLAATLLVGQAGAVPAAWSTSYNSVGFTNTLHTTFLTSGTTYVAPSDWQSTTNGTLGWANKIECVGGGEGGVDTLNGGYGADYSASTNIALTPGGTATYAIGAGSSTGFAGGDSWFNGTLATNATVTAKGGNSSTADRGTTTFAGGTSSGSKTGGGGAAGLNGAGATTAVSTGGTGDNGFGGVGGASQIAGGNGTEWNASHGSGGGGGGGAAGLAGDGGLYGAGGGAGSAGNSGLGGPGLCVVQYYSWLSGANDNFSLAANDNYRVQKMTVDIIPRALIARSLRAVS